MANYPKYQGQRMIKEDEYAYLQELIEAHDDPSADWGGSGTEYTAGTGIDIDSNNEISANIKAGSGIVVDTDLTDDSLVVMIDQEDIPYKSDLSTVATTGSYNDLTNKPSIPSTATSTSSVTPSTIQLTFTYSDNTTETITLMTGASVTTTTTLS